MNILIILSAVTLSNFQPYSQKILLRGWKCRVFATAAKHSAGAANKFIPTLCAQIKLWQSYNSGPFVFKRWTFYSKSGLKSRPSLQDVDHFFVRVVLPNLLNPLAII